jgi:hypothetical protein
MSLNRTGSPFLSGWWILERDLCVFLIIRFDASLCIPSISYRDCSGTGLVGRQEEEGSGTGLVGRREEEGLGRFADREGSEERRCELDDEAPDA